MNSEPDPAETDSNALDDIEQQYAAEFDQESDPLSQYNDSLHSLPDPFEFFIKKVIKNRDSITNQDTIDRYRLDYRQ